MANPPTPQAQPNGLIGGIYRVNFDHVIPGVASPMTAYAVSAERGNDSGLMAISVARGWPARPRVLTALAGANIANLVVPLAHGAATTPSGEAGYFVICPAPRGPSVLATLRPWSEQELFDNLLRPVTAVLAEMQDRNVSHRAIRPDNLFQVGQRGPVTVGAGWAAPPGCHQPDWLEPPYSAVCLPHGRGDGSIADDVYALGAVMVMLSIGANPMEGLDADTILRRKLDLGSYNAIIGNHRLPAALADLLRGMLAEEPDHRPSPALLRDPQAARARRIAARAARRSQRPLDVGGYQAFTSRMLGYALKQQPEQGVALMRSGVVDRWLRRGIGDAQTAVHLDEVVKLRESDAAFGESRSDALMVTRAIAVLDPLAPLHWRSVALWPDGLGPALDHALHYAPDLVDPLVEIAQKQISRAWYDRRPARDVNAQRLEAKERNNWLQATQGEGGTLRLSYMLNALAPCESPLLAGRWVTRLPELLPALEQTAGASPRGNRLLVDAHLGAFIVARRDERIDVDISQLAGAMTPTDFMSQVRLLSRLQTKLHRGDLPALCAWAVDAVRPMLDVFASRTRRERLAELLDALPKLGQLPAIVALMDDKPERANDEAGLAAARARVVAIDAALVALEGVRRRRPIEAKRLSQDVAGAFGLLACVVGLALAMFD